MSQGQKQINPKSSLLWNVVDPDDPYDIRKSMIARLPDHTENFMGGNLEIVCLMQAAEIERLNTYLSQFRLRYRELERKQLDRHSYEIQIKQLSQKSNEVSKLRLDNQKLRDYIRKQTIQLQELTRRPSVPQSLQTEHAELFKKYQSLLIQLQNSREANNSLTLTLNKSIDENKELRIKYDRLDKQRLTEITQQREKYELKIRQRIQVQIKEVQHKYSSKIYQLESDCRLYKQQLESKNHEIASLMSRNQSLKRELQNKQKQTQITVQYEDKVKELQTINFNLSRKVEQLERVYEQYTKIEVQLRDLQKSLYDCEQKNRVYRAQIDRLNQSKKDEGYKDARIIQLQNKAALLSQQIERLAYMMENKNRDAQQFDIKINSTKIQYETKIKQLTFEYEQKISSTKQSQQKVDALEAELRPLRALTMELKLKNELLMKEASSTTSTIQRCHQLQGELRKANTIITDKNNHILGLEAKLKSGEASIFQMSTIKNSYIETTRMLKNVEMILTTYGGRPSEGASNEEIIKSILRELEKKKQLREELQRQALTTHQLRNALKQTQRILTQNNELINRLRKEMNDMKGLNQQYQSDIKKGNLVSFNVMDVQIRRNVEETRKKLQIQFEKDFRKNLEQKAILERSNSDLSHQKRVLQQQITVLRDKLERKNIEVGQNYANVETRYMNQVHDLSNSLKAVREQNQKLTTQKNKLKNTLSEFEREIGSKHRQQNEIIKDVSKKYEELRIVNEQLNRENHRLKEGITEAQDTAFRSQRQIEQRFIKIYTSQLQDKDNIISSLQRQVKVARQEMKTLQTASESSSSSLKNYRDRLLMVSQQIERLNEILTNKNKEIEGLRSHLDSIEATYRKQSADKDEEIRRIQVKIEDVNITIRRETQAKQEEIRGLKGHVDYLNGEIHKRIEQSKQLDEQNRGLKSRYENMEIVLRKQINERQLEIKKIKGEVKSDQDISKQLDEQNRSLRAYQEVMEAQFKKQLNLRDEQIENMRGALRGVSDLKNQLAQRDNELENLKQELMNLNAVYARQFQQFEKKTRERQGQIKQLQNQQLSNLRNQIQELLAKKEEYQGLLNIFVDNQKNYSKRLAEFQTRNNQTEYQLKRQREELQLQLIEYQKRAQLQSGSRQEYERKIMEQDIEIRNLKQMLKQMEEFIQKIRESQGQIKQRQAQQLQMYRNQIRELQQQLIERQNKAQSQSGMRQEYERKILEQDVEIRNLKQMLKQMEEINIHTLAQRDSVVAQYKIKNDQQQMLINAINEANEARQGLNRMYQTQQIEVNQLRNFIAKIKNQKTILQNQLNQGGALKIALTQRDEKIRKLLQIVEISKKTIQARELELSQLNLKITTLESTRNRVNSQLQVKCQQNEIQIRNLKQMVQQMEEINMHTIAERDQLFQLSHQYKDQINQLRLALQTKQKSVSEAMFLELKSAYHSMESQYVLMQDKIKKYEAGHEGLVRKNQQYEGKLRELMSENDRLRVLVIQRQQKLGNVEELLERISELEIELENAREEAKEWQQKYVPLYNAFKTESQVSKTKILEYQKKITALDQQFEQINTLFRTTRQENEDLKASMRTYQQLIEKNRQLGSEIDRLNVMIVNLKQELSDTRLRLTDQMALQKRIQEYMSLMVILFAEIETLRMRVSQTQLQCQNVRRSSLTPHRVDRQVGRSVDSKAAR